MNCNIANPKESEHVDIWQETFPVRFGSIDRSNRTTLSSIFQYFQEAAISHAENLDVGRQDLKQAGQGWILSRICVNIERRPDYCETITVRSWPRGVEKLFAVRYYDILDKNNNVIVTAGSCWLILDIEKRRPLRPNAVVEKLPSNEDVIINIKIPSGLEQNSGLQKITERKALYTDIDYNGHVNNVRYVQWIEDSIDINILEKADKMNLDVNYLSEILPGENIEIFQSSLEIPNYTNAFAIEGRKQSAVPSFRAELCLM